jgi:hypothetical protein
MSRSPALVAALLAPFLLGGCLGDPPIEERWTLLEVVRAGPTDANAYAGTAAIPVEARVRITFREVLTGFVVVEVRQSDTITASDTAFDRRGRHLDVARDVDFVLANSTSLGFATHPVTGFDHLVREVELSFDASPAQDTGRSPSPSESLSPRAVSGLFLLVYFSDDVEEVEIAPGEEIEIVHPVLSTEMDILSTGLELVPVSAPE